MTFDFNLKHIFYALVCIVSIRVLIFSINKLTNKSTYNINCDWIAKKIQEYNEILDKFKKSGVSLYNYGVDVIRYAIEYLSKIEDTCKKAIECKSSDLSPEMRLTGFKDFEITYKSRLCFN